MKLRQRNLVGNPDQVGSGIVWSLDAPDQAFIDYLQHEVSGPVAIDCETIGINPKKEAPASGKGSIFCWSMSVSSHLRHSKLGIPLGGRIYLSGNPELLSSLKPWLESEAPKVGHGWHRFDHHMFLHHGIKVGGIVGDTMRMHQLLFTDKLTKHGLKHLMKYWLGYELGSFSGLFSRPKKLLAEQQKERLTYRKVDGHRVPTLYGAGEVSRFSSVREPIPLNEIPENYPQLMPTLMDYATLDAKATLELYYLLRPKLDAIST